MKYKIKASLAALFLSVAVLSACSGGNTATQGTTAAGTATVSTSGAGGTQAGELELTLEELAQYNGQNGKPAYVAVDGIIYDVTNASPWKGGTHNGFTAGKDLTKEIKTISPHGVSKLQLVPVVGKIKK